MVKLQFFSKYGVAVTILTCAVLTLGIYGIKARASTIEDCKPNSIIMCGEPDASSFINQVEANDDKNGHNDLQAIYSRFGLEPSQYDQFVTSSEEGIAYQDGTVKVNGQTVATDAWSIGRTNFSYTSPYTINGQTYYKAADSQVLLQNLPVMVMFNAKGQMQFAVMNACGNPIGAHLITPQYSCDLLQKTPVSGQPNTYDFTTSASASNNAQVAKVVYDFGDGSETDTETSLSSPVRHTFSKPGTWTVRVTVYVSLPGNQMTTVTSANCQTQVTVAQPYYQCVMLTPYTIDKQQRSYQFVVTTTQGNGATLQNASLSFGDGSMSGNVSPSNNNTVEAEHTYAQDGTYAVSATVNFNTPAGVQSDSCVTQISPHVTPPPPPPSPPPPTPPTPTPAAPVKVLVNTGPGSVLGIFTVASAAGGLSYRFLFGRRSGRN